MLSTLTAMFAMVLAAPAVSAPATSLVSATRLADHGKLNWFQGSYEELLAEAKAKNQIVFIDLWRDNCVWCTRLDKETFTDDAVVAEMKDVLCFNINGETEAGRPLAAKFKIEGYPALVLLDPDGSLRDNIGGYLTPAHFLKEIRRVKKGDDTVSGLRRSVEAKPEDLDVRYAYAQKLAVIGDLDAANAQIEEIRKLDPEGKSAAMHMLRFEEMMNSINGKWMEMQGAVRGGKLTLEKVKNVLVMEEPLAFLAQETHPSVLFEGWQRINFMQAYLANVAQEEGKTEEAMKYRAAARESHRKMWPYCAAGSKAEVGSRVATSFWEKRAELTPDEKSFALTIAREAEAADPDSAVVLDALACCLHMNGQKEEAVAKMKRSVELDPANENYKKRLAELSM